MECRSGGALPPYSFLLGGRLNCVMHLSKCVRDWHYKKYGYELVYSQVSGYFGRTGQYDRININGQKMSFNMPESTGAGQTHYSGLESRLGKWAKIHIPDEYESELKYGKLTGKAIITSLHIPRMVLRNLGFDNVEYHGIHKPFYRHTTCRNLNDVINNNAKPEFTDLSPLDCFNWWKERWFQPRRNELLKKPEFINWDTSEFLRDYLNQ